MQVSDYFKEFIVYYVEGIIFNEELLSRRKYLQRYSSLEQCDYDTLQENLNLLIDALNVYKEKKSMVCLKIAKQQAQKCFLPEHFIEDLAEYILSWEKGYSHSLYMKKRGGDIFNEIPGGHLLKK